MAVAPTGNIFKALSFDNVSSRTYGVYITGEAVYNAPEREVEMISIPGRNGQFALDKGRFENIEVTYPAGIFADSETNFADAISEFRNFLCSRKGYVRLQDEYNPNEYRMAIYKSGLEVEPAQLKAGEFEITFDCKPQRFLTSGETAVEMVVSGSLYKDITNPTLFESHPLFAVTGHGSILIGKSVSAEPDYEITLNDESVGSLDLLQASTKATTFQKKPRALSVSSRLSSYDLVDNGDTVTLPSFSVTFGVKVASGVTLDNLGLGITTHNIPNYTRTESAETIDAQTITRAVSYGEQTWTKSSSAYTVTDSASAIIAVTPSGASSSTNVEITFGIQLYCSPNGVFGINLTNISIQGDYGAYLSLGGSWETITAVSTQSVLGNPTYIDCEIGEAYKIVNGEIVSLNKYIELGSQLPVLVPGNNTIQHRSVSNPTSILLTPRWWKV